MTIRKATLQDFDKLYAIGKMTPELKVSAVEEFMDTEEFQRCITNPVGLFLLSEEDNKICGFLYVNAKDLEKPFEDKYACLVYLVVLPQYRKQGIAQKLYDVCVQQLKEKGITHMYCWANTEGQGEIVEFMKKQKFIAGHNYMRMDKKL
ncbi:MAG: GNAT family N-acetyltransferase [Candidatus Absconditabacterales bacterium]